jgi:hypothetical protein
MGTVARAAPIERMPMWDGRSRCIISQTGS